MIKQINDALEARELIKVSVLQNAEDDKKTIADKLVSGTNAELVQIIGNVIVLYKESREKKRIVLPE